MKLAKGICVSMLALLISLVLPPWLAAQDNQQRESNPTGKYFSILDGTPEELLRAPRYSSRQWRSH